MALDPQLQVARLYLATAYANQFIPGADSADNTRVGEQAIAEFKNVLKDDPNNVNSVAGIASIYYNMKKFDDAKTWYQKQISLDPKNPEAYYSIGVIAWAVTYPRRMEVKSNANIQPDQPIKDAKVREPLCEKNNPLIEDGLNNLNKAVELRPDYDDAMAYINLMWREKADCEGEADARKADIDKAEDWISKATTVRNRRAQTPATTTQQ